MYNRLSNFFESNLILSPTQFGFRKNMSTEDAIISLTKSLYSSLNNKYHSISVFIDFQKAFDTINHSILLKKLEFYGVRGQFLNLIQSYLTNRYQVVRIGKNISDRSEIRLGVPQGSILGPLLFLVYVNDVFYVSNVAKTILFADDNPLVFTHHSWDILFTMCNQELEKFRVWCLANRLSINVNKTFYMIFSNSTYAIENIPHVYIDGQIIVNKTDCMFLGMKLDNKLKFNLHVQYISGKVSKSIGIIFRLSKIVPSNVLRSLYFSFIYSYLTYCICIWGGTFPTHLNRLTILQKRIIRIITGSEYLAHTNDLFYNNSLLKLPEIYEYFVLIYMFKNLNTFPTFQTSTRTSDNLRIDFHRLSVSRNSIAYNGPTFWNTLPP